MRATRYNLVRNLGLTRKRCLYGSSKPILDAGKRQDDQTTK